MIFKRGQVTIFIILGILIVGAIAAFFILKEAPVEKQIPSNLNTVYTSFLSCLEDYTLSGVRMLESRGGYIEMPEFEAGSAYMPFSSQLDFLGNPIPYWYYVSGNNIPKEQVPSLSFMQNELSQFIDKKIRDCNFDSYYSQGFEIDQGIPKSEVRIKDGKILVNLDMPMNITQTEESFWITSHSIEFSSNLKKLYDSAIELYSKEQTEMFLEEYTVDFLRNYAPVDGVELTCSPLTWNAEEVFLELQKGIEANILALKTKGGDFSLTKPENKYFIINTEINARFINSRNWTSGFEVNPSRGALLIAEPVGNQEGLGILGFCYVPYHFVYDVKYPVLIQVYEDQEFFQFPVAVVLKGNVPREPMNGTLFETAPFPEICDYKNTEITVYSTDKRGNPIEANISYECAGASCDIGETSNGTLKELFPQCVNGNMIIHSKGYRDASVFYTVMEEGEVSIFLDKLYEKEVNLKLSSRDYSGNAIINFISGDETKTIMYPIQKKINLSEGQYQIQVYIYESSSLTIQASNQRQCIEVPKSGIGSLFGLTEEKCFDYQIPSQIVSNALSGGGKENYYILESELEGSKSININAYGLPKPSSIEQLQNNYILFENKGLDVIFA
jgi:hypothetical protein